MLGFVDTHTHSEFSPDSKTSVRELLVRAGELGLYGIGITDHLDLDAPRDPGRFEFSIQEQQEEIAVAARLVFPGGGCKVLRGIEIGLQPGSIGHSREFISGYSFDQITASIHFVDGEDPYFGNYYEGKTYRQAYSRVLELIYNTAVEFRDFDVVGHFDFVARYAPYSQTDMKYADFPDYFDTILRFLAQEGKALEINTKTYDIHNGHLLCLDLDILRRFRELGGEFVTLGSDSHSSDRLADKFRRFAEVCSSCGFAYLTYFEKRKPQLYKP